MFIKIVSQWFKMMNVKNIFASIRFNDNARITWSKNYISFESLDTACNIVSTCRCDRARGRKRKLTKFTADAFIVTTKNNIAASKYLIENHDFQYILPSVFSQDPLEKFFGQGRQRCGGNFYIDIGDVISAAKAQHVHTLQKYDIIPQGECNISCLFCDTDIDDMDLELLNEIHIEDTQ